MKLEAIITSAVIESRTMTDMEGSWREERLVLNGEWACTTAEVVQLGDFTGRPVDGESFAASWPLAGLISFSLSEMFDQEEFLFDCDTSAVDAALTAQYEKRLAEAEAKEALAKAQAEAKAKAEAEAKASAIANLTQHEATPDQLEAGVKHQRQYAQKIAALLTFDEPPTQAEMDKRARELAGIAKHGMTCKRAMIGGAPFFMSTLERALQQAGVQPLYAFSKRESVEETDQWGNVKKVNVFKHLGFVEVKV